MILKIISNLIVCNFYLDEFDMTELKGTDHRFLFQNADGSINMGVCYNDPDIEYYDILWLNYIAQQIELFLNKNDGFISFDKELQTRSCYIELQRNVFLNNVGWV